MSRTVFCEKLHQEAPGLTKPPFPSALGERIFNHISQAAWQSWLNHQTMLINEYRLSVVDPKAKAFLLAEMEKFLFGEGSATPAGYQSTET